MVTKRELLEALKNIGDDDEVIVALRSSDDDEGDDGFAETEAGDEKDADGDNPGYIPCDIDDVEVVDATDDSGKKALLLYTDLPEGEEDDTIYVDDEGYYVDAEDNYVTKNGEPSDTPVKADPEDISDDED